ncbi:MAG: hypothetical protein Q4A72_05640 [Bacillota bacterium]|nr:hypothetical protein [Bacillota bacterium]
MSKKLIVCLFSLLFLLFSQTQKVLRADEVQNLGEFSNLSLPGFVYEEMVDFRKQSTVPIELKNASLKIGEKVILSGDLVYDNKTHPLLLSGDLYPFDAGIYENNLVLGDLKASDDRFEVINFRVYGQTDENDLLPSNQNLLNEATLSLAIKDLESGKVIFIQSRVEKECFDSLFSKSSNFVQELNLDERSKSKKLLELFMYEKPEGGSSESSSSAESHGVDASFGSGEGASQEESSISKIPAPKGLANEKTYFGLSTLILRSLCVIFGVKF